MIFGRTGDVCMITGKYRSFGSDNQRISLQKGETFPKPVNGSEVIWILTSKEGQPDNVTEVDECNKQLSS